MNWLEKCDPRHSLDVTGWDQLYQALPQPEKHLNNLSKVKLLILKVNTISIYLKPWIISKKKRGNYITTAHSPKFIFHGMKSRVQTSVLLSVLCTLLKEGFFKICPFFVPMHA